MFECIDVLHEVSGTIIGSVTFRSFRDVLNDGVARLLLSVRASLNRATEEIISCLKVDPHFLMKMVVTFRGATMKSDPGACVYV